MKMNLENAQHVQSYMLANMMHVVSGKNLLEQASSQSRNGDCVIPVLNYAIKYQPDLITMSALENCIACGVSVNKLRKALEVSTTYIDYRTLTYTAISDQCENVAKMLINDYLEDINVNDGMLMVQAVKYCKFDFIKWMVKHGPNVNGRENFVAMMCAKFQPIIVFEWLEKHGMEMGNRADFIIKTLRSNNYEFTAVH